LSRVIHGSGLGNALANQHKKLTTPRCSAKTAFGLPVEPEV
jgi:hypothetical protein